MAAGVSVVVHYYVLFVEVSVLQVNDRIDLQ